MEGAESMDGAQRVQSGIKRHKKYRRGIEGCRGTQRVHCMIGFMIVCPGILLVMTY